MYTIDNMKNKSISIIIGIIIVVGIGVLVYKKKQLALLTTKTENQSSVQNNKDTIMLPLEDGYEDDDKKATNEITNQPVVTTSPTPSGISLSQVAEHNSRSSCWSVINGNVYDLTSWIPNHPGGEARILSLCGIDGSNGYNSKHGGQSRPASILAGFKLGVLLK